MPPERPCKPPERLKPSGPGDSLPCMRTYDTQAWKELRAQAIERDGGRCTIGWLMGDPCSEVLHAHHLRPIADGGLNVLENLATVCDHHHPSLEALRASLKQYKIRVMPRPKTRCSPPSRLSWEESLAREIEIEKKLEREYGVMA